jgi:hypothetical protein
MQPTVQTGIGEIKAAFASHTVDVDPDGEGGAFVRVNDLPFDETSPTTSGWVAFRLTFAYPHADIYPHYLPSGLLRRDGTPLGDPFRHKEMKLGRFTGPSIELSRRSKDWNPGRDTAAIKLAKILDFIRTRP